MTQSKKDTMKKSTAKKKVVKKNVAPAPKKAELVRAIILEHINLVQNDQDDLVIKIISEKVDYSKPSDCKRAYLQQRDKVLAYYRELVAEQAKEVTLKSDGTERQAIYERKGKRTHAEDVRDVLRVVLEQDTPLIEAVDEVTVLVEKRYSDKGELHFHKPAYYRLQARNEIARLLPKLQSDLGYTVSTPQEIKVATRGRNFLRKTL